MNFRVVRKRPDFRFDRAEDTRDLFDRTVEVIRREDPQCHPRHAEVGAPIKHVIELVRPERINRVRIVNPMPLAVSPISI